MKKVFFLAFVTLATTNLVAQYKVTFNVKELTVTQRDNIYVTGTFNNWDTANKRYKVKSSKSGKKSITINLSAGKYEYKFTRGNWLTIEKDRDCDEVDNRVAIINKDTIITVIIQNWKDLCTMKNLSIAELRMKYFREKNDAVKVELLIQIGYKSLMAGDLDMALEDAEQALSLSKKIGFKSGTAGIYRLLGHIFSRQNNFTEARKNYSVSLKGWQELNERNVAEYVSEDIGTTYQKEGRYDEALRFYYSNLHAYEKKGEKASIARTLYNIGEIHSSLGHNAEAIRIYKEALPLLQESWNLYMEDWIRPYIAQCHNSIAIENAEMGLYAEALRNHLLGFKIFQDTRDKAGMSLVLASMGNICRKQGLSASKSGNKLLAAKKFAEALNMLEESIKIHAISEAYINAGKIFTQQKNYDKAKNYFNKALELSHRLASKEGIKSSFEALAELDSAQGNFKRAYDHYKMYILYRDSLVNEESTKRLQLYSYSYQFEKQENQIKLLSTQNKLSAVLAETENQRKNFAYAGIAIILLTGGYGFYRYRRRKVLQSNEALIRERLRISRELHDEVGATLSGISMYSHLAKEQIRTNQTEKIEKSLNIMQQSSGEMVNKLNDIVWLINPEQDSLEKLIQRLEEYASDMVATKQMKVKITVPVKEIILPIDYRRNIYLFCKEAVNNAVKYSDGSLLELKIQKANGRLEVSVSDNGKGFDEQIIRRGNGLENMKRRAEEIGAIFSIQSDRGIGSFVSMQLKIT